MNYRENSMHGDKGLSTEIDKSFPIHYGLWKESY